MSLYLLGGHILSTTEVKEIQTVIRAKEILRETLKETLTTIQIE